MRGSGISAPGSCYFTFHLDELVNLFKLLCKWDVCVCVVVVNLWIKEVKNNIIHGKHFRVPRTKSTILIPNQ